MNPIRSIPMLSAAMLLSIAAPARADLAPGPPAGQVRGSLDKEVIRRVIRSHIKEVQTCYEASLARKPELEGRIIVQFAVAATGDVTDAKTQETTMKDPPTEDCINAAVKTWKFPKPQGGGIVIVSYPFVLKASVSPPPPPNKPEKPEKKDPPPAPAPARPAR